jgi:uncharacterized protein (TIGR04255 family)
VRPFQTPLSEVSAQIDLTTTGLVEFRARSFHETIKDEYPRVQRLPVFLVEDPVPGQQFHMPAYRFFNAEGTCAVQLGPRMMSVNALTWDKKWEGYRTTARSVVDRYVQAMPDEMVMGYSIGFYNRIRAADMEEALSIYRLEATTKDTLFDELSYQTLRQFDVGVVVTQVAVALPDERVSEKHLMVNNIVRRRIEKEQSVKDIVAEWRVWLEAAHEVAKELFWSSLTPEAQKSWKETVPA